jgi:hypothetical protein
MFHKGTIHAANYRSSSDEKEYDPPVLLSTAYSLTNI